MLKFSKSILHSNVYKVHISYVLLRSCSKFLRNTNIINRALMNVICDPGDGQYVVNPSRADPADLAVSQFQGRNNVIALRTNQGLKRAILSSFAIVMQSNVIYPTNMANTSKLIKQIAFSPLKGEWERATHLMGNVFNVWLCPCSTYFTRLTSIQ